MMAYFFGAISVACIAATVLAVKRYWLGRGHGKAAADDALREIYGQYWTEVRALTQRRMLDAPSDEDWLADIRARASESSGIALPRERRFRWVPQLAAAVAVLAASAAFYFLHPASAALLIIAVAATLIAWRLISVTGLIWQERARVTSHCTQMETSALNGIMLCERLPDGTTLLVMPGQPPQDPPAEAEAQSNVREIKLQ